MSKSYHTKINYIKKEMSIKINYFMKKKIEVIIILLGFDSNALLCMYE